MKCKLKINIGEADQRQHDLPTKGDAPLLEGDVIDVPKKTADFLVRKGWATADAAPPPDDATKKKA